MGGVSGGGETLACETVNERRGGHKFKAQWQLGIEFIFSILACCRDRGMEL